MASAEMKKALCTEIQSAFKFGGTSGGRTHDKRIKSAELCTTINNIINRSQRDKKAVCEFLCCFNGVKTADLLCG